MQEKKEEDLRQALNKVYEVGMDEVGRGAIFGPVFSAVVVLTEKNSLILEKIGPKTAPLPTSSIPTSDTLFNAC